MKRIILLILVFSCLSLQNSAAQEPLKVNTSIKPPFSTVEEDGFFDQLLRELFGRVGREIELIRLPAERALQMANSGHSDVEVPRISGLGLRYPNLLEIEEPVIEYTFTAFAHRGNCPEELVWEELEKKSVGYIIGWKIYEKNTPKSAHHIRVTSPQQLFHLLDSDRIDFALYEKFAGWHRIHFKQYRGVEECSPPLSTRPMHLYMHKKHAPLIPMISEELRQMKKDGSLQRIIDATLVIPSQ